MPPASALPACRAAAVPCPRGRARRTATPCPAGGSTLAPEHFRGEAEAEDPHRRCRALSARHVDLVPGRRSRRRHPAGRRVRRPPLSVAGLLRGARLLRGDSAPRIRPRLRRRDQRRRRAARTPGLPRRRHPCRALARPRLRRLPGPPSRLQRPRPQLPRPDPAGRPARGRERPWRPLERSRRLPAPDPIRGRRLSRSGIGACRQGSKPSRTIS